MATSFVELRGYGFWTSDRTLEIWLHLLTQAVRGRAERPDWLEEACEDWHEQATVGFTGCVSADLDHWVGAREDRRVVVAELARDARRALRTAGVLRREDLAAAGLGGPGTTWTTDVAAHVVLPVAEAFSALLEGELRWDSRSSPVL